MRLSLKLAPVCLALCLLALSGPALAQTNKSSLETLRGIRTLGVVVTGVSPQAEKDGLLMSQLQAEVEDRLGRAGVKTLTRAELSRTPGQPHLVVSFVDQKRSDMDFYSISIAVYLVQMVRLSRDSKVVTPAQTWSMNGVMSVGGKELASVRKIVGDYVDRFIAALQAVNPGAWAPASEAAPAAPAAEAAPASEPAPATDAAARPDQPDQPAKQ